LASSAGGFASALKHPGGGAEPIDHYPRLVAFSCLGTDVCGQRSVVDLSVVHPMFRRKEPEMAGTKSQAKGKKNKVVGGVKKEAGRVTKNRKLEAKGAAQKAKGSVQETTGKAARKVTK
jgi:uncharacterized protein YjbJ (UPF0337 family)